MRDAERLEQMRDEARRRDETARIRERDRDRLAAEVQKRSVRADEAARRAEAARDSAGLPRSARPRRRRPRPAARRATARPPTAGSRIRRVPGGRRRLSPTVSRRPSGSWTELLAEAGGPAAGAASGARRGGPAHRRGTGREPSDSPPPSRKLPNAAGELARAYRSYLRRLTELRIADPDELIGVLEAWAVTGDGANPAVAAVDDAARAAGAELGRLDAELSAQRAAHAGARDVNSRERSSGCERAATTPRRFRIRGSPASGTAVRVRRCGR